MYVSESRALATLEILAGLPSVAPMPSYVLVGVAFDEEDVTELALEELDSGWHRSPPTFATQRIGDEWLDAGASAVLRVPSAVVRGEYNFLLNPAHLDFPRIQIGTPETLYLDPRLLTN